jgi:hypothetical protein
MLKYSTYLILFTLMAGFYSCSQSDALEGTGGETYELIDGSLTTSDGNGISGQNPGEPGVVTAGEWSDLINWGFWSGLMMDNENFVHLEKWQLFPKNRYTVVLSDQSDRPVVDAEVRLYTSDHAIIWEARTDNKGRAELWNGLDGINNLAGVVKVFYDGQEYALNPVVLFEQGENQYSLPIEAAASENADVMFMVDATGSMGDEITYLKTEMEDVIKRTATTYSNINIRLSTVFYRDNQDIYLTRSHPFTSNISEVSNFVDEQFAGGGGDYEEAVHAALVEGLAQEWSEEARARIIFLILDAPPHNTPDIILNIQNSIKEAAQKGIKIIPVSASGINKETEFLMRVMAIASNGTYTFITDDSGVGNDHLEPTLGQYEVEYLNDLLVRLIGENCSY